MNLGCCVVVFIALSTVEAYQKENIEDLLLCYQSDLHDFPVYRIKSPKTKLMKMFIKAEIKMCSTPSDEKYCANLKKSGWLKYGDCYYDGDNVSCDLNKGHIDWLEQISNSYFRIFIYNDSSLITVTSKFQYPSPTGCYCTNPESYLPFEDSFRMVVGGKDSVHFKIIKPDHMKIGLNSRKYDFRFHRSASKTERILPATNTNPLFFDIHNLTKCGSYAFQVSILPDYLNCKLSDPLSYYFIKRFTFDPNRDCRYESSFDVHLVYVIALPIIIAGLVVIFLTVKRNCVTPPGRRSSLDTETNDPLSASEHSQLSKRDPVYDSIDIGKNSEVINMKGDQV